jgi:ATP-dependent phosphoenolpyruvate carboxykinase
VSLPSVKQEHNIVGLTDAEGKPVTVGKAVTQEKFKTLFREVRKHLSDIDNLFVHDGRVGAEKVRVFTDNAAVALALKHLLLPTPLGKPEEFQHGLTAYVVSSIEASTLGKRKSNNFRNDE